MKHQDRRASLGQLPVELQDPYPRVTGGPEKELNPRVTGGPEMEHRPRITGGPEKGSPLR